MHPLLLMITSSSSLQYAEYPKYNGWSFRTILKIEKKKNRFKWKLHVELIDVAWSTKNSMNFKLACQQERSDESKQSILQYVVHCTSWLWLVQVKTT